MPDLVDGLCSVHVTSTASPTDVAFPLHPACETCIHYFLWGFSMLACWFCILSSTRSKLFQQDQKHFNKIKNISTRSKSFQQDQKHLNKIKNISTRSKTFQQDQKHFKWPHESWSGGNWSCENRSCERKPNRLTSTFMKHVSPALNEVQQYGTFNQCCFS